MCLLFLATHDESCWGVFFGGGGGVLLLNEGVTAHYNGKDIVSFGLK